jgi:hypothetical protein
MGEKWNAKREYFFNIMLSGIKNERKAQDAQWGFPQKCSLGEWGSILAEETGELCKGLNDLSQSLSDGTTMWDDVDNLVYDAVQVAAVAISIVEHLGEGEIYAAISNAQGQAK